MDKLREIIEELLRKYWKEHLGIDDYGCSHCKEYVNQALSAIKSEMLGKLPQEDCPIIRNKEKRFQCKECSQLRRPCFHMIKNNLLSQIKQIVEEMK